MNARQDNVSLAVQDVRMFVSCRSRARALFARATLCLLALCAPAAAEAAPFSYTAREDPVAELLCAYAAAQQKSCSVSPEITGTLSGDLRFPTENAFFAFLENSRDIVSYADDATIHYYARSQMESATLPLNRVSVSQVTAALREMRAFASRFPLRPISSGRMLRLSAPPAYVALVTSLVAELEGSFAAVKGSRVFRLKHAWADDIELEFLNKTTIVPGVATLIRRLTADGADAPAPVGEGGVAGVPERLKGKGLISRSGTGRNRGAASRDADSTRGARILADPRLNAVIVWDDEELLPFYENMIREMDQPVSLVEIRAAVVDVSVDRLRELGIAWNAEVPVPEGRSGFGVSGGANAALAGAGNGLGLTTIYRNGMDVFMARVRALEEDGDAAVLSRPAVLTLDNIQASLEVTSTYYISVAGQEEVDLFDVTYGTILRVTPHVIPDSGGGRAAVKLTVHVEDGNSAPPAANSGLAYPVVSKTMVNTQAQVGDGQALIIGGHYYESSSAGDSGIPGLKNLPLLGGLFKTQADRYNRQERLFIIAPRVVDPESIQRDSGRYEELFTRTMMDPPVTRTEYTTGGCARQRRVSVPPAPVPGPARPVLAPARPVPGGAAAGAGAGAR
jgi:type III secretion protein C